MPLWLGGASSKRKLKEGTVNFSKYVASPVFGLLAIVQAVRFFEQWPVTIKDFPVPVWASAVAAIVFAALSVGVWREANRTRR